MDSLLLLVKLIWASRTVQHQTYEANFASHGRRRGTFYSLLQLLSPDLQTQLKQNIQGTEYFDTITRKIVDYVMFWIRWNLVVSDCARFFTQPQKRNYLGSEVQLDAAGKTLHWYWDKSSQSEFWERIAPVPLKWLGTFVLEASMSSDKRLLRFKYLCMWIWIVSANYDSFDILIVGR